MDRKRWIEVCGACGLAAVLLHGECRHLGHPAGDHPHSVTTLRMEPPRDAILDHMHADVEVFAGREQATSVTSIGSRVLTPPTGMLALHGMPPALR